MGMLCLSRLRDQSIMIGDNIRVTILRTGTQTMIGIEAPPDVKVHREEVFVKLKRILEEQDAAKKTEDEAKPD